jgi:hypothetical protein
MVGAYVLATLHLLPQLSFLPRLGTWTFHGIQSQPAISWYGYIGWSLLGGVLAGGLAGMTRARLPWRLALLVPALALVGLSLGEHRWFGF